MLAAIDGFYVLYRVDLSNRLVGTQANDPGEAQGIAAVVTVGAHHSIKSDFQHNLGLHVAHVAVIDQSVREEPLRHFVDLDVRQSGISFADVDQLLAFAHGKV